MLLTGAVDIPPRDREVLQGWTRARAIRADLVQRAHIVLLAGDGGGTNEIVRRVGISKPTVILWKQRYAAEGLGGPRTGRSRDGPRTPTKPRSSRAPWKRRPSVSVDPLVEPLLGAELGLSNVP